ncbi:MAG TPA: hypothetical protein VHO24_07415 [Opitutaceae bacterium]|nr:hypothetical protein [Opitutaceae bacterium]
MNPPPAKKVVLAVHGIGDQVKNSTILSTAIRFCDYYSYPGMVPLGRFYGALDEKAPAVILDPPPHRAGLTGEIGFAEVYWADVARDVAEKPYTLQETTTWVRSIVNRVRVMAGDENRAGHGIDYQRIRLVLEEMVQAIRVLDSLLFLAKKAGLVEFNLRRLLDNFLGDVQLVTEFSPLRRTVLNRFHAAMDGIESSHKTAEIYVVAHSEGTVVAFLALLEACGNPAKYPWIRRVRGLMTLGSPIDKHLILWPDLFRDFTGPADFKGGPKPDIRWINYVDYGDPVGFELDTAREWMRMQGYDDVFKFDAADDYAFSRYYLPGKAHVDYWNDAAVFNHFIRRVVAPEIPTPENPRVKQPEPPKNYKGAQIVSYVAGYVFAATIATFGVYVLYKAVGGYLAPDTTHTTGGFVRQIGGLTALVIGTTVWLRIVQLAAKGWWLLGGPALYLLCGGGAWWLLKDQPVRGPLGWMETLPSSLGIAPGWGVFAGSATVVAAILLINSKWLRSLLRDREAEESCAAVTPGEDHAPQPQHLPPDRNTLRLMIWAGGALLAATAIVFERRFPDAHTGALWRVLVAGGASLYLWWLATLVFDLIFVWHRYIRGAGATEFLRKTVWRETKRKVKRQSG